MSRVPHHIGWSAFVLATSIVTGELNATTWRETRQSCPEGQWFEEYARGSREPNRVDGPAAWTEALLRIRQRAEKWIPLRAEGSDKGAPCVPDASEPRRLVVATYVLDFVMVNALIAWQPGGRELVEWACDVLRGQPLTDAGIERTWFLASVAVLERVQGPSTTTAPRVPRETPRLIDKPYERTAVVSAHVGHADGRLPGLGVWPLARVVAEELDSWPERRGPSSVLDATRMRWPSTSGPSRRCPTLSRRRSRLAARS